MLLVAIRFETDRFSMGGSQGELRRAIADVEDFVSSRHRWVKATKSVFLSLIGV